MFNHGFKIVSEFITPKIRFCLSDLLSADLAHPLQLSPKTHGVEVLYNCVLESTVSCFALICKGQEKGFLL